MLSAKGAHTLQTKSQTVEEAANELINMLVNIEPPEDKAEDADEEDAGFDEEEQEGMWFGLLLHLVKF